MTPEQHRSHAEKIIRSHATNVETLSIWEILEDADPTDDDVNAISRRSPDARATSAATTTATTSGEAET